MVELVEKRALERRRALRVAQAIHEANPLHINHDLLELFRNALNDL